MMNIGKLSSKYSVGVKFKEGSGLKANGIFVILQVWMFLKAILQKESPNQSLPKVSSEVGLRRCSSK